MKKTAISLGALMLLGWMNTPGATGETSRGRIAAPDTIVVKMVDHGGGQWRFEPARVEAHTGDVIHFIQTDVVPHNVQFKKAPSGAKLGVAMMGPFLLRKGDTYDLPIDRRFVTGTYGFVCTPHELMGMKGTLIVS